MCGLLFTFAYGYWIFLKTVLNLIIMIWVFFLPAKLFDEAERNLYY